MAEILSYNHYRDMHNDVQFSAMFFGKNFQNIPLFNSTQTTVKEFDSYGLKVFTFTGKERDSETGFSYFGARYYDSDLMTGWLSVDPMADKYPSLSPYAYCAWNPVKLVDPDGEEISPIYDTDGNFLGTDDNGLQGEALIMNKADFRQGMSNKEARTKGRTLDNMSDTQALKFANNGNFEEFLDHYNSLSSRPDWDGIVTRDEGITWAKTHPNALENPTTTNTLYVNTRHLDFGNISISDLKNGVGNSSPTNTLNFRNLLYGLFGGKIQNTVYALGRVDLFLLNENGDVRVVNNSATDYDWNTGGGFIRDKMIRIERKLHGLNDNHGFKTVYYGTGKIHK